jgi:NitT/TauT family transport system ATP-binding protein
MLKFENLTVRYGKQTVIDQLNFDFPEGKIVAITGASGIGKTTLLNVIAGFLKPHGGSLHSDHRAPAYVFQEPRLFPWMTALENVTTVCKDAQRAEELLLRLLPDPDAKCKYPDELSGGMKQRVSIARALAYDSDLLLMDEPFKGLDPDTRREVSRFVFDQTRGKTVLMVTHDGEDLSYCQSILRLEGIPVSQLILEKSGSVPSE